MRSSKRHSRARRRLCQRYLAAVAWPPWTYLDRLPGLLTTLRVCLLDRGTSYSEAESYVLKAEDYRWQRKMGWGEGGQ